MFNFLLRFIKKLFQGLKHWFPSLYCVLFDRRRTKWTVKRYLLSYLIGISFAIIFWEVCIRNLMFPLDLTYILLIVLIVLLGLGFVFTSAIKCIALLTCVGLVGKSGRSFIRALCVAYIIAGPISNLALNGQEIARVFACTTVLTYNLTKTRFDLMTKPFQNTLTAMKNDMTEIKRNFESFEDVLQPIKDEIEGEFSEDNSSAHNPLVERFIRREILSSLSFGDRKNESPKIYQAEHYKNRYSNKMRLRCKSQLLRGENRCKDAFSDAHDQCLARLPIVLDTLLCWPLKIDYVCNMHLIGYQESGGICDPSDAIDPNLGKNMVDLKQVESDLFLNASDVEISYEFVKIQQPPQLKAAKETANVVIDKLKEKKRTFDYMMDFMQKMLSFVFLRVVFSSIAYHKNYLAKIEFDNLYVTSYFRKIDERRKSANQHSILPMKKFEDKYLVDTEKSDDRTKKESATTTYYLLQFLLEFLLSGFFLLLDHMIVILLDIVASKSEITYYQEGEHVVSMHVNGTGLMARLIRKTLQNFNMHERVSTMLTNKPCLPNPSVLSTRYYLTLLGIYIATLLLIYNSSVTLRSRRYICSLFYQKREKQRVLHLYNKLLKQRKSIFDIMIQRLNENIEARRLEMSFNLVLWLRLRCPKIFGWLRWFKIARRKCLICEEREPRKDTDSSIKFVECSSSNCDFVHCEECWLEIGEICMACRSEEKALKYCSNYSDI